MEAGRGERPQSAPVRKGREAGAGDGQVSSAAALESTGPWPQTTSFEEVRRIYKSGTFPASASTTAGLGAEPTRRARGAAAPAARKGAARKLAPKQRLHAQGRPRPRSPALRMAAAAGRKADGHRPARGTGRARLAGPRPLPLGQDLSAPRRPVSELRAVRASVLGTTAPTAEEIGVGALVQGDAAGKVAPEPPRSTAAAAAQVPRLLRAHTAGAGLGAWGS